MDPRHGDVMTSLLSTRNIKFPPLCLAKSRTLRTQQQKIPNRPILLVLFHMHDACIVHHCGRPNIEFEFHTLSSKGQKSPTFEKHHSVFNNIIKKLLHPISFYMNMIVSNWQVYKLYDDRKTYTILAITDSVGEGSEECKHHSNNQINYVLNHIVRAI